MSDFTNDMFQRDELGRLNLLKQFYEGKNINAKTELSMQEIGLILSLDAQDEYIKSEFGFDMGYKKVTKKYKEMKISHKRLGRKEAVEVLKPQIDQSLQKSNARRLLGI